MRLTEAQTRQIIERFIALGINKLFLDESLLILLQSTDITDENKNAAYQFLSDIKHLIDAGSEFQGIELCKQLGTEDGYRRIAELNQPIQFSTDRGVVNITTLEVFGDSVVSREFEENDASLVLYNIVNYIANTGNGASIDEGGFPGVLSYITGLIRAQQTQTSQRLDSSATTAGGGGTGLLGGAGSSAPAMPPAAAGSSSFATGRLGRLATAVVQSSDSAWSTATRTQLLPEIENFVQIQLAYKKAEQACLRLNRSKRNNNRSIISDLSALDEAIDEFLASLQNRNNLCIDIEDLIQMEVDKKNNSFSFYQRLLTRILSEQTGECKISLIISERAAGNILYYQQYIGDLTGIGVQNLGLEFVIKENPATYSFEDTDLILGRDGMATSDELMIKFPTRSFSGDGSIIISFNNYRTQVNVALNRTTEIIEEQQLENLRYQPITEKHLVDGVLPEYGTSTFSLLADVIVDSSELQQQDEKLQSDTADADASATQATASVASAANSRLTEQQIRDSREKQAVKILLKAAQLDGRNVESKPAHKAFLANLSKQLAETEEEELKKPEIGDDILLYREILENLDSEEAELEAVCRDVDSHLNQMINSQEQEIIKFLSVYEVLSKKIRELAGLAADRDTDHNQKRLYQLEITRLAEEIEKLGDIFFNPVIKFERDATDGSQIKLTEEFDLVFHNDDVRSFSLNFFVNRLDLEDNEKNLLRIKLQKSYFQEKLAGACKIKEGLEFDSILTKEKLISFHEDEEKITREIELLRRNREGAKFYNQKNISSFIEKLQAEKIFFEGQKNKLGDSDKLEQNKAYYEAFAGAIDSEQIKEASSIRDLQAKIKVILKKLEEFSKEKKASGDLDIEDIKQFLNNYNKTLNGQDEILLTEAKKDVVEFLSKRQDKFTFLQELFSEVDGGERAQLAKRYVSFCDSRIKGIDKAINKISEAADMPEKYQAKQEYYEELKKAADEEKRKIKLYKLTAAQEYLRKLSDFDEFKKPELFNDESLSDFIDEAIDEIDAEVLRSKVLIPVSEALQSEGEEDKLQKHINEALKLIAGDKFASGSFSDEEKYRRLANILGYPESKAVRFQGVADNLTFVDAGDEAELFERLEDFFKRVSIIEKDLKESAERNGRHLKTVLDEMILTENEITDNSSNQFKRMIIRLKTFSQINRYSYIDELRQIFARGQIAEGQIEEKYQDYIAARSHKIAENIRDVEKELLEETAKEKQARTLKKSQWQAVKSESEQTDLKSRLQKLLLQKSALDVDADHLQEEEWMAPTELAKRIKKASESGNSVTIVPEVLGAKEDTTHAGTVHRKAGEVISVAHFDTYTDYCEQRGKIISSAKPKGSPDQISFVEIAAGADGDVHHMAIMRLGEHKTSEQFISSTEWKEMEKNAKTFYHEELQKLLDERPYDAATQDENLKTLSRDAQARAMARVQQQFLDKAKTRQAVLELQDHEVEGFVEKSESQSYKGRNLRTILRMKTPATPSGTIGVVEQDDGGMVSIHANDYKSGPADVWVPVPGIEGGFIRMRLVKANTSITLYSNGIKSKEATSFDKDTVVIDENTIWKRSGDDGKGPFISYGIASAPGKDGHSESKKAAKTAAFGVRNAIGTVLTLGIFVSNRDLRNSTEKAFSLEGSEIRAAYDRMKIKTVMTNADGGMVVGVLSDGKLRSRDIGMMRRDAIEVAKEDYVIEKVYEVLPNVASVVDGVQAGDGSRSDVGARSAVPQGAGVFPTPAASAAVTPMLTATPTASPIPAVAVRLSDVQLTYVKVEEINGISLYKRVSQIQGQNDQLGVYSLEPEKIYLKRATGFHPIKQEEFVQFTSNKTNAKIFARLQKMTEYDVRYTQFDEAVSQGKKAVSIFTIKDGDTEIRVRKMANFKEGKVYFSNEQYLQCDIIHSDAENVAAQTKVSKRSKIGSNGKDIEKEIKTALRSSGMTKDEIEAKIKEFREWEKSSVAVKLKKYDGRSEIVEVSKRMTRKAKAAEFKIGVILDGDNIVDLEGRRCQIVGIGNAGEKGILVGVSDVEIAQQKVKVARLLKVKVKNGEVSLGDDNKKLEFMQVNDNGSIAEVNFKDIPDDQKKQFLMSKIKIDVKQRETKIDVVIGFQDETEESKRSKSFKVVTKKGAIESIECDPNRCKLFSSKDGLPGALTELNAGEKYVLLTDPEDIKIGQTPAAGQADNREDYKIGRLIKIKLKAPVPGKSPEVEVLDANVEYVKIKSLDGSISAIVPGEINQGIINDAGMRMKVLRHDQFKTSFTEAKSLTIEPEIKVSGVGITAASREDRVEKRVQKAQSVDEVVGQRQHVSGRERLQQIQKNIRPTVTR